MAINDALVPSARLELPLPRIVSVLFPFGWPVVHIDPQTGQVVDSSYQYQGDVQKHSGTRIPTDTFLSRDCAVVSAVIHGSADVFNHPTTIGADLTVVHNPSCDAPLPRGFVKRGREYWVEDQMLYCTDHNEAAG